MSSNTNATSGSGNLNAALVLDAVKALLKYEKKRLQDSSGSRAALLIDDFAKYIIVQIQLAKPIVQKVQKPVRVKIPHSLFSVEDDEHSVCLFCKTDDKEAIEKYLESHPIAGLTKVLGMNDVKKIQKEFKNRKQLLSEHSHFLCHTSIARQLYNSLGSDFAQRNHFPVQVSFESPSQISGVVAKAVASSYMHLAGNNICIKIGKTSLSETENAANIVEGVAFAVEKFQNGWSDVHSVHLKTKDSASLPIYTKFNDDIMEYVTAQTVGRKDSKKNTTAGSKRSRDSEADQDADKSSKKVTPSAKTPQSTAAPKKVKAGKK